jgi:hypothetical protein
MRGLRTPSSSRNDLRTADDMDRDVVGRKKSHGRAPHLTIDTGGDHVGEQDNGVANSMGEFRFEQNRG